MSINIAVTGSFCSGKSTICRQIKEQGFKFINTDLVVHEALKCEKIKQEILKSFGLDVFDKGEIDRKKLAKAAFKEKTAWLKLNSIIHPAVIDLVKDEIENDCENEGKVFEIPLLFEADMQDLFDVVICVDAPEKIREKRAQSRGFIKQEIKERSAFLINEKIKKSKSDFVIINKDSEEELHKQVENIVLHIGV
ncbi:MAG: dephospho-CoA kinase [Candidatus Aureabacteria bacterium]|nr:dephospho-CoA kinase [Candidatus Auribacterota bacterium]